MMETELTTFDEADQPKPHWARYLFSWPAMLVLAWAIYELTAQPALGVAMICVKFGWEDFVTALWLRRRDKVKPGRARASFWLYVSSGLWTTAITATIMVFAFAFLAGFVRAQGGRPAPAGGPPPHVIGALLTAFIGFGLATLLTGYAVMLGLIYRDKLWLNSAVHLARRSNTWPPPDTPGRGNKLMWLVLTAMLLTLVPAVLLMVVVMGMLRGGAEAGQPLTPWMPIFIIGALVGVPFIGLLLRDFLARKVIASAPSECWPTWEINLNESGQESEQVTEL